MWALEDCLAIKLTNVNILKIYQHDLEQFVMIQMNMAREVSRRLRHTDELLFQKSVKNNEISQVTKKIMNKSGEQQADEGKGVNQRT